MRRRRDLRNPNELTGPQAIALLALSLLLVAAFYFEFNRSERRDWCERLARPASPDHKKCLRVGPEYVRKGWYRK